MRSYYKEFGNIPACELSVALRGPATLTWELRTGDCKVSLEDKRLENIAYYISSKSIRDAERE